MNERKRPADVADEEAPNADTIDERLKLWSPSLVDLLYETAKDRLAAEEKLHTLLIGKANALLGVTGLSLTVAFSFGGLLLNRAVVPRSVQVIYIVALVAGFIASACAIMAIRIRGSREVGAIDVFRSDMLTAADAADVPNPPASSGDAVDSTGTGSTAYKRYLTSYFWRIYASNVSRHATSASWVFAGQMSYGVFLVTILLAALFVAGNFRIGGTADAADAGMDAGVNQAPLSTSMSADAGADAGTALGLSDGGVRVHPTDGGGP